MANARRPVWPPRLACPFPSPGTSLLVSRRYVSTRGLALKPLGLLSISLRNWRPLIRLSSTTCSPLFMPWLIIHAIFQHSRIHKYSPTYSRTGLLPFLLSLLLILFPEEDASRVLRATVTESDRCVAGDWYFWVGHSYGWNVCAHPSRSCVGIQPPV